MNDFFLLLNHDEIVNLIYESFQCDNGEEKGEGKEEEEEEEKQRERKFKLLTLKEFYWFLFEHWKQNNNNNNNNDIVEKEVEIKVYEMIYKWIEIGYLKKFQSNNEEENMGDEKINLLLYPNVNDLNSIKLIEGLKNYLKDEEKNLKTIVDSLKQNDRNSIKIHLLHDYNDLKDAGQALIGKIAVLEGTTTKALYPEFDLNMDD